MVIKTPDGPFDTEKDKIDINNDVSWERWPTVTAWMYSNSLMIEKRGPRRTIDEEIYALCYAGY